jgi:hypothetical protein
MYTSDARKFVWVLMVALVLFSTTGVELFPQVQIITSNMVNITAYIGD